MGSQASAPVMSAPQAAPRRQRPPLLVVGVFIFLGSELMFFGSLFATYFTLRADARVWPPPDIELAPLWRATLFTLVLVASSFTMQAADRAIKRGNVTAMRRWIWLTCAMGVIFRCGQFWDYFTANFGIETNAYGSAFYTMTGFHSVHVIAGLVVMLIVLGRSARHVYDEHEHAAVEAATYYWHFVDVVWVGLFSVLFLLK